LTSFAPLDVNLLDRRSDQLVAQIDILREAVARVRAYAPFRIDAWVVLPHRCLGRPSGSYVLPMDPAAYDADSNR
jgi:putative transposase